MTGPVSAVEITQLVAEARRLTAARGEATNAERLAYHEAKLDILERIAAHPSVLVDPRTAEDAAVHARAQVDQLRATGSGGR